jgi:hypothetical protein
MRLGKARVRRDPYHGWRLYWCGCPDPFKRLRFMYRKTREKGWNRRISFAVAWWVVIGGMPSFRYASRRGFLPSRRAA